MSHPFFDLDMDGVDAATMAAFRAFKRAMMLHRRLLMCSISGRPMHPAQASGLQMLAHHDGIGQSELAELLHVSRPTVTVMLQRMDISGLIQRRPDQADSRITRVYLTGKGRKVAAEMQAGFVDMMNTSIGWMPEADKLELARILNSVNDHVSSTLQERGVIPHAPHPIHDGRTTL